MPDVVPVILPQLLRVLHQPQVRSVSSQHLMSYISLQVYNVRTQSRAVRIFHTLCSVIYAASETTPTLATSLLLPALPQFSEGMLQLIIVTSDLLPSLYLSIYLNIVVY